MILPWNELIEKVDELMKTIDKKSPNLTEQERKKVIYDTCLEITKKYYSEESIGRRILIVEEIK